ncbi:MAG: hypothetical protein LBC61_07360 [Candidatus Peribacteria bacterium]|jgi:hypothetical protein|nr:hypothetical protein [Candidatus Peribacteria bacterium]
MRKLFFTFLILVLGTNYSFAAECLIQDKSSPALLEYIKNNQAVIKNITTEISKVKVEQTTKDKIVNSITKAYNSTFNFGSYYSSFNLYAVYPISNEVPSEIMRDHNLLKKEWE